MSWVEITKQRGTGRSAGAPTLGVARSSDYFLLSRAATELLAGATYARLYRDSASGAVAIEPCTEGGFKITYTSTGARFGGTSAVTSSGLPPGTRYSVQQRDGRLVVEPHAEATR